MTETPKKPTQPASGNAAQPRLTRRAMSRRERERRNQRRVIIVASTAIGLAVLAVLIGVLYDRVWVPSRPVAQVGNTSLSRGGYWTERRNELARNIAQNLQLLQLFGDQLSGQFGQQLPALDQQAIDVRSAPLDEATVNNWIDQQLIVQGASKLNLQANDGEIAQTMINDLSRSFPAPPPIVTNTNQLSATATLAPTAAPTAAVSSTTAISPTNGPTATPAPTNTPQPTPAPDQALTEQDPTIQRVYDAYSQEILRIDSQGRPHLTLDDFKAGLHDLYYKQTLTNKIEEQLVAESSFTPTTDPSNISVSHILITVTVPLSATDTEREAAYAQRKPAADAILAQLRGGADFATLAKEKSEDGTTRNKGGDLPSFDKTGKTQENTQIDPAIVQAGLTLKEGAISDLIRTPFGWHIVKLNYRTVDSKEDQLRKARTDAFNKWLADQHTTVVPQRFPPQTPTATPQPTSATAAPLPTAVLAGPITNTNTLSGTAPLSATQPLSSTQPLATPTPTATAATTSTTAAPTSATAATTSTTAAPTSATAATTTSATAAPTTNATAASTSATAASTTTP